MHAAVGILRPGTCAANWHTQSGLACVHQACLKHVTWNLLIYSTPKIAHTFMLQDHNITALPVTCPGQCSAQCAATEKAGLLLKNEFDERVCPLPNPSMPSFDLYVSSKTLLQLTKRSHVFCQCATEALMLYPRNERLRLSLGYEASGFDFWFLAPRFAEVLWKCPPKAI